MGPKTRAVLLTFGLGTVAGAVLAHQSMGRHRSDLFSRRPLRRLSALGYLSGHASVETTNRYAAVDLDAKRAAIAKAEPVIEGNALAAWRSDSSILDWLEAL